MQETQQHKYDQLLPISVLINVQIIPQWRSLVMKHLFLNTSWIPPSTCCILKWECSWAQSFYGCGFHFFSFPAEMLWSPSYSEFLNFMPFSPAQPEDALGIECSVPKWDGKGAWAMQKQCTFPKRDLIDGQLGLDAIGPFCLLAGACSKAGVVYLATLGLLNR